MFDATAREFLSKPLTARFATNGADGYPHVVPVWFMLEGDVIILISIRATKKMQNIVRDPRGTVSIGGDVGDSAGYMIRGDLTIEDDPGQMMTHRMIDHYEDPETAAKHKEEWKKDDIVVIRRILKVVNKVM